MNILEQFPLRSRKRKDYNIWAKCLLVIYKKRQRGIASRWYKEELLTLAKLRDKMNRGGKDKRGYRDYETIKKTIKEL